VGHKFTNKQQCPCVQCSSSLICSAYDTEMSSMFNRCNCWPTLVLKEKCLDNDSVYLVFVAHGSAYAVICSECIYPEILACTPPGKAPDCQG
jgi:hypothetical protein